MRRLALLFALTGTVTCASPTPTTEGKRAERTSNGASQASSKKTWVSEFAGRLPVSEGLRVPPGAAVELNAKEFHFRDINRTVPWDRPEVEGALIEAFFEQLDLRAALTDPSLREVSSVALLAGPRIRVEQLQLLFRAAARVGVGEFFFVIESRSGRIGARFMSLPQLPMAPEGLLLMDPIQETCGSVFAEYPRRGFSRVVAGRASGWEDAPIVTMEVNEDRCSLAMGRDASSPQGPSKRCTALHVSSFFAERLGHAGEAHRLHLSATSETSVHQVVAAMSAAQGESCGVAGEVESCRVPVVVWLPSAAHQSSARDWQPALASYPDPALDPPDNPRWAFIRALWDQESTLNDCIVHLPRGKYERERSFVELAFGPGTSPRAMVLQRENPPEARWVECLMSKVDEWELPPLQEQLSFEFWTD